MDKISELVKHEIKSLDTELLASIAAAKEPITFNFTDPIKHVEFQVEATLINGSILLDIESSDGQRSSLEFHAAYDPSSLLLECNPSSLHELISMEWYRKAPMILNNLQHSDSSLSHKIKCIDQKEYVFEIFWNHQNSKIVFALGNKFGAQWDQAEGIRKELEI